ncbi:restriction endonuclease [archaeon]|nr:restriction endonuclease [archaeon]
MQDFSIKSISDLESISYQVKWQYFEKLVAWIFDQNGFCAEQNVVVKFGGQKRQFDVIAEKYDKIFLVECKKWKSSKQKLSALKSAVKKHAERCEMYSIKEGKEVYPVIVTLLEEDITDHDGVPIVPIMKLDWFLNNCE